jgi:hypothetical protein
MGVMPISKEDKIKFVQEHLTIWADNAVAIGTTAAAVTALQTKLGCNEGGSDRPG